jgi:predicted phage terminase large subunit-like protein
LTPDEEKVIQEEAVAMEMAYKSLVDFRKIYLPAPNDCEPAPFHYEWSDILLHGRRHFAQEAFRESGKSVIVIRAHSLYRLVFPSTEYDFIVIIMANQTLASARLKDLSEDYLSDPKLCANLIEVKKNNEKTFEVVVKDIYGKPINVRIDAYGKGSSIRGLLHGETRPKLIIIDDPQDLEDMNSDGIMEKDYNWFLSDVVFLGKKSRIFMIGNNLGESCLIERVIANKEYLGFQAERMPVVKDGTPTWPGKYTIEYIDKERDTYEKLGKIDIWYRERMCESLSPDNQIFKEEYFKKFSWKDLKLSDLNIFMTVDLAISQKDTADYTAIMVVGANKDNHWFILDCSFGRFDPTQTIDEIFRMAGKWNPQKVGVEKVAYQAAMHHFLDKEMPKRNMFFTITQLRAQRKKEERISAIQPRFSSGSVWIPDDAGDWWEELKGEMLAFPHGVHDDLLDALAYIEQIAVTPLKRNSRITNNLYAGSM